MVENKASIFYFTTHSFIHVKKKIHSHQNRLHMSHQNPLPSSPRRHNISPSYPPPKPPRIPPHHALPPLIQQQNAQPETHWQEPILHRYLRRPQNTLQTRNIQPKKRHHQRKQHRRKQVVVPRLLVKQRRMLKNTQPSRPNRQQIEPLPTPLSSATHTSYHIREQKGELTPQPTSQSTPN